MKEAVAAAEQRLGVDALPVRRVAIIGGRWNIRSERTFITHDHPQPAGPGLPVPGASTGTVVSSACSTCPARTWRPMASAKGASRHQPAHPVGQGRAIEFDAFAGIDAGLSVQRRMVADSPPEPARAGGAGPAALIGRLGIGGCTIVSQARQLSFGRIWRITLKLEGTYSSTSRSSWPMRLNTVPPQPGQVQATSWVMVSRGRCGGSGLRTGCMRSRRLTGWPVSCLEQNR